MFSKVPKGFFLKGHGDRRCHLGMSRQQGFQFRKIATSKIWRFIIFETSWFKSNPWRPIKKKNTNSPRKKFWYLLMYKCTPKDWISTLSTYRFEGFEISHLKFFISHQCVVSTTGHHQVTSSIHAWPVAAPRTWRCAAHEQRKQRQEAAAPLRERPEIQVDSQLSRIPKDPTTTKWCQVSFLKSRTF